MGAAPFAFMCPAERKARAEAWNFNARQSRYTGVRHRVVRTGPCKPNPSRNRGSRTLDVRVAWKCLTCGAAGWTVHTDITRMSLADDADRAWQPIDTLPAGITVEIRRTDESIITESPSRWEARFEDRRPASWLEWRPV